MCPQSGSERLLEAAGLALARRPGSVLRALHGVSVHRRRDDIDRGEDVDERNKPGPDDEQWLFNNTAGNVFDTGTINTAAVPEPSPLVPAGAAAALTGLGYGWRKRRAAACGRAITAPSTTHASSSGAFLCAA